MSNPIPRGPPYGLGWRQSGHLLRLCSLSSSSQRCARIGRCLRLLQGQQILCPRWGAEAWSLCIRAATTGHCALALAVMRLMGLPCPTTDAGGCYWKRVHLDSREYFRNDHEPVMTSSVEQQSGCWGVVITARGPTFALKDITGSYFFSRIGSISIQRFLPVASKWLCIFCLKVPDR